MLSNAYGKEQSEVLRQLVVFTAIVAEPYGTKVPGLAMMTASVEIHYCWNLRYGLLMDTGTMLLDQKVEERQE